MQAEPWPVLTHAEMRKRSARAAALQHDLARARSNFERWNTPRWQAAIADLTRELAELQAETVRLTRDER